MLTSYLKHVPMMIVLGVAGFTVGPIFLQKSDPPPSKSESKPPAKVKPSTSIDLVSIRDPFQIERVPSPVSTASTSTSAALAKDAKKVADSAEAIADEDKVLDGMKLGGTFIDSQEQLALIDNKVYARGDQLRGADGLPLPYVISEVRKDRAVIRRGRRSFVLAFSNVPQTAAPRTDAPGAPAALAAKVPARTEVPVAAPEPAIKKKDPVASNRNKGDSGDQRELILQLLASLGGSSGGQPSGPAPGAAGGLNPGSPGVEVNQSTIAAGLDALIGKYVNISREGATP